MLWFNDSLGWRWFFNLINTVITYLALYIYIFKASRVDLSQYKNNNYYYYNFKTWLRGHSGKVHVTSWKGQHGLTWVNVWIKYFSLKTWLGSQLEARFRSWVGRVNSVDPKLFIFFQKNSTSSWPMFCFELTWVFDRVMSSQSFLYFFLNSN